MNPSHVFLGLSLMSGVLPKKKPNTYAITSLQIIIDTGTMNQIKPATILLIIIYDCLDGCMFSYLQNGLMDLDEI